MTNYSSFEISVEEFEYFDYPQAELRLECYLNKKGSGEVYLVNEGNSPSGLVSVTFPKCYPSRIIHIPRMLCRECFKVEKDKDGILFIPACMCGDDFLWDCRQIGNIDPGERVKILGSDYIFAGRDYVIKFLQKYKIYVSYDHEDIPFLNVKNESITSSCRMKVFERD